MKLHVFIDGTWLFRACGKVMAEKTETPARAFPLDFSKLNSALLAHVQKANPKCVGIGCLYFSTSIFELPPDFDTWAESYRWVTGDLIAKTKNGTYARMAFTKNAVDAGYSDTAVFHPTLKEWSLKALKDGFYQEKQVDASVVALLVRSAITCPQDFHSFITGDSDILPAIRVAYPEYTRNIVIVTSHPDELRAANRQASWSLNNFQFDIPPFFLQEHTADIIQGEYVYTCANCGKVFVRNRPIPQRSQPYCVLCFRKRE